MLPIINYLEFPVATIDSLHIDEKSRYGQGFPHVSSCWTDYITWHHVISNRLKNYLIGRKVKPSKIIYGHLAGKCNIEPNFSVVSSIKHKNIRICFIGRMTEQKRPLLAFSMLSWAIKFAHKMGFNASIDFVGEGHFLPDVLKATKKAGLTNYFTFHPSNTNIQNLLKENDILLISSENEGVTLVAFEAYNSGTLVVSTDVGAQKEFIPDPLLINSLPLLAFFEWKYIFKNLLIKNGYAKNSCDQFRAKAVDFYNSADAETVIKKLY